MITPFYCAYIVYNISSGRTWFTEEKQHQPNEDPEHKVYGFSYLMMIQVCNSLKGELIHGSTCLMQILKEHGKRGHKHAGTCNKKATASPVCQDCALRF